MTRLAATLALALLIWPVFAIGQSPGAIMPGSGPQSVAAMPEQTKPDTVTVRLLLPEGDPAPVNVAFYPDTITVGSNAILRLQYGSGQAPQDLAKFRAEVEISQEWFQWAGDDLVAESGADFVDFGVKIYQINPFRVEMGSHSSQVVLVDFRTSGVQETAAIRDPRRWGWNLLTLVVAALILTILVLLVWWAWTARKVATEKLPDWEVPPPAWLKSCVELKDLHDDGILDRGLGRDYLDRLAAICRRYIAARYRVGAVEMTGHEIALACAERGHPTTAITRFTTLLEDIDSSRYNPQTPSPNDCRLRGRDFLADMAEVRVLPRFTPVPAAMALAADIAWSDLEDQLLSGNLSRQDDAYSPDQDGGPE